MSSEEKDPRIDPEKEKITFGSIWEYTTFTCPFCEKVYTTGRRLQGISTRSYSFKEQYYDTLKGEYACFECIAKCACIAQWQDENWRKCVLCKGNVCQVHHYDAEARMCKKCMRALLRIVHKDEEES